MESKRLFQESIEAFLEFCQIEKGLSENTIEAYDRDLRDFENFCKEFGIYKLEKIEFYHLRDHIQWLADIKQMKGPTTTRHRISIRQFFKFLNGEELLSENPAQQLECGHTKMSIPTVISNEQIDKLLTQPDKSKIRGLRDAAMLELLYATGLRVTELVKLKKENWKEDFIEVIGKGNKQRIIPLNLTAKRLIRQYWEQLNTTSDYMFLSSHLKPMTRQNFWMIIKKYAMTAGITKDLSPHSLRHAFATHMLANGMNLRYLQELLGHSDITTTQVYTHVANNRLFIAHEKYHPRGRSSV